MNFSAKTAIFDFPDKADITNGYCSVRSIEFYLGSTLIELAEADITCYATSIFSSSYDAANAFITSLSKTDGYGNNEWLTSSSVPQRLNCVFNTPQTFDKVVINNSHDDGMPKGGIKTFVLSISDLAETEVNPSVEITTATEIFSSEAAVHVTSNVIDDQVFAIINHGLSGSISNAAGDALEASVFLYDQRTAAVVSSTTTSLSNASYSFDHLVSTDIYFIVVFVTGYQAAVYNDLVPVEMD